ncbi:MAG: hypothetical protein AAB655_02010 [Patescibacteria group bacterium]
MSELRQDLVSGDWIIMAPERAKRPHDLLKKRKPRKPSPKQSCPFENLEKSGNWPPILSYPSDKKWEVAIIPNKYPALRHFPGCSVSLRHGPHDVKSGSGDHDLVITRDHNKNLGDLSRGQAVRLLTTLQKRYRMLSKDPCNVYTSTFFNWGGGAGATIYHPHYQVLTLPIIPPDVGHSLDGSRSYFQKHRKCVHCIMLDFDVKEKKRVIEKNRFAISIAPFVSRVPFETRVFPLRHRYGFERTPLREIEAVASVLQSSLRRIKKYLKDPDLNFFIHTAPLKDHRYNYYHWHIEVIPKITMFGGFELSTGVEINVVDPEQAAIILRGGR